MKPVQGFLLQVGQWEELVDRITSDVDARQAERFWSKVDKAGPMVRAELGNCWIWLASKDRKGYGVIGAGSKRDGTRRPHRAHRFGWWIQTGELPGSLCVCHRCDNPACVRIDHLFLGTVIDNNRDMFTKGRMVNTRGEQHGRTKLTESTVLDILGAAAAGEATRAIARRLGHPAPTVQNIVSRRTWAYLAYPTEERAFGDVSAITDTSGT